MQYSGNHAVSSEYLCFFFCPNIFLCTWFSIQRLISLTRHFVDPSGWNIMKTHLCALVTLTFYLCICCSMILLMPSGSLICSTFNQTWRVGKCPSSTYIWSKKVEKNNPQKLKRNTQFFFLNIAAKKTQQENSGSKMWLIDQLYNKARDITMENF